MKMHAALKAVVVAVPLTGAVVLADAARAADAELKTQIDAFFHRIEASSDGRLHWDGADTFDVQSSGDTATATLANIRLSFRKEPGDPTPLASITLDRVEIRSKPAAEGGNLVDYAIALPALSTLVADNGVEVALSLQDAHATARVENPGSHQRAATLTLAGGRIEDKGHRGWASFGPVAGGWKLVRADNGGWTSPVDFELKTIAFLIADAPLAGTVERIAYAATAAGPSLAKLDAWRDHASELREATQGHPEKKAEIWLSLLPELVTIFSSSRGELQVEHITAKKPEGETLVTLAKAKIGGGIIGLDGDKAGFRLTIGHDGLTIASSLVPETQVPRRAVIDIGIEDIAMSTVRTLAESAESAGQMAPDAGEAERQKATQQLIGAAMSLNPVLRVYDAAVDFKDVALDLTGEARRAPPAPIGYAVNAELAARGFDALPEIVVSPLARAYLPLLKFLGAAETGADGTPIVKFHTTSTMDKPLSVNGSNLASWFGGPARGGPGPSGGGNGPPRNLRLAEPPMSGDDVSAVQKALPSDTDKPLTSGVYDSATALAVARFQKQAGLNVDGVVDAATRDKLGLKPPAPPAPPPRPANPTTPKN